MAGITSDRYGDESLLDLRGRSISVFEVPKVAHYVRGYNSSGCNGFVSLETESWIQFFRQSLDARANRPHYGEVCW